MASDDRSPTVEVRFRLRIGGEPWDASADVPEAAAEVSDLIPIARAITERVVAQSCEAVVAEGRSISCAAGCGACCRQPVPIARSEAEALAAMVRGWPEARRRRVEQRFAEGVRRLEAAGLLERLVGIADIDDLDERQALGRAYFDLGIACPFLEDESCSIHPERPIACREYLVTSDPSRCADPDPEGIDMVPVPVRPSVALFRMGRAGAGDARPLPLILALREDLREPEPGGDALPGPALLEAFVRGLAGGGT